MNEEVLDFESKIKNIKDKLDKLTTPDLTLKESVAVYKSAMVEIEAANKLLEEAKLEFEVLNKE